MVDTKDISKGAVTTLTATDLVMAHSGGAYHPISFADLAKAVRDTIRIGGRNLLKGTENIYHMNGYMGHAYVLSEHLKQGDAYTLSFEISEIVDAIRIDVYAGSDTRQYIAFQIKSPGRHTFQFVANSNAAIANSLSFYNEVKGYAAPGSLSLSRVKLERGNIATDWSPAPEDLRWGGVIARYSNTYNYTAEEPEKGGLRDGYEDACRQVEIGTDGHLAFGSLDALSECVGRVCEDAGYVDKSADAAEHGSERSDRLVHNDHQLSVHRSRERAGEGKRNVAYQFRNFSNTPKSWQWRHNILPRQRFKLVSLEGVGIRVADRKEVACGY